MGMDKKNSKLNWDDVADGETRLEELRARDVEIANLAMGLQMRTRITKLEAEVAQLRSMEKIWMGNRLSRLYFLAPRALIRLFKRPAKP